MELTLPATATPATEIQRVCIGSTSWRGDSFIGAAVTWLLQFAARTTDRVVLQRFVRFRLRPATVASVPQDIRLTPITAGVIEQLRRHPDAAQANFASGLAFWNMGVRNGFIWMENGEPLCFQWQLTDSDLAALRRHSSWGNLYPPLGPGMAQREKLWTFSGARRKGIASRFAAAMLAEARRQGVTTLVTHVSADNVPALALVEKSGWTRSGSIVRYEFDIPLFRWLRWSVALHFENRGVRSQHKSTKLSANGFIEEAVS